MRYKPKSTAALHIALGGLPDKMRVKLDSGVRVSAKTVGELRNVTARGAVDSRQLAFNKPLANTNLECPLGKVFLAEFRDRRFRLCVQLPVALRVPGRLDHVVNADLGPDNDRGLRGVSPKLEERFDAAADAAERSFRPAL
jgi:hypothetical protein